MHSSAVIGRLSGRKSLVTQVVEVLADALEKGAFADTLPGERRLCELLRVSRPTLRAALARLAREGRIQTVHGKPSRVLLRAQTRFPEASRKLVLLTPLRTSEMPGFFRLTLDELRMKLARLEMTLEVVVEAAAGSSRPRVALERLVGSRRDALWLLYLSSEATQRWFDERDIPCVLAGTPVAGVGLPGVDRDYRAACRHAASTLINAGCRQLALLLPEGVRGGEAESTAGYLEGVAGREAPLAPPWVVRHDTTVAGVCRAVDRLLLKKPRLDGLLVGRSSHALTALTHLLRTGVRVPGDVALIARDDDTFLAETAPEVARYVTKPAHFAGALSRVVERLCGGKALRGQIRLLVPSLVRGETID
jgi:LacI family transcriptional regulator